MPPFAIHLGADGHLAEPQVALGIFDGPGVDHPDQFVYRHVPNQRQPRIAHSVEMLERSLVLDERALQRRFEEPGGRGDAAGRNVTEVGS